MKRLCCMLAIASVAMGCMETATDVDVVDDMPVNCDIADLTRAAYVDERFTDAEVDIIGDAFLEWAAATDRCDMGFRVVGRFDQDGIERYPDHDLLVFSFDDSDHRELCGAQDGWERVCQHRLRGQVARHLPPDHPA